MIYPENFEIKIGFDRIKNLVAERCLSTMGLSLVDKIRFLPDKESVVNELAKTFEFQHSLFSLLSKNPLNRIE
jgi:DNA mismatch repair protein MutS2